MLSFIKTIIKTRMRRVKTVILSSNINGVCWTTCIVDSYGCIRNVDVIQSGDSYIFSNSDFCLCLIIIRS